MSSIQGERFFSLTLGLDHAIGYVFVPFLFSKHTWGSHYQGQGNIMKTSQRHEK